MNNRGLIVQLPLPIVRLRFLLLFVFVFAADVAIPGLERKAPPTPYIIFILRDLNKRAFSLFGYCFKQCFTFCACFVLSTVDALKYLSRPGR